MSKETNDYDTLSRMFHECGLEIEIEDQPPEGTLNMWKWEEDGQLVGGIVLSVRDGRYVLADLAVRAPWREKGIGLQLMDMVLEEARRRGAEEIWACAKIPEYYLTKGWEEMDRATSPEISNCQTCEQFNVTCFPCIIRKDL